MVDQMLDEELGDEEDEEGKPKKSAAAPDDLGWG
jgi:hypothetical protein